MTRKKARESAFILIFEKEFNDSPIDEILELAKSQNGIETDDYAKEVVYGVFDDLNNIDETISKYALSWKLDRISKTSLAALRLAIYEIKNIESIPISVSINEAVEIVKKYATPDDASFVNGILSSVAKEENHE